MIGGLRKMALINLKGGANLLVSNSEFSFPFGFIFYLWPYRASEFQWHTHVLLVFI